MSLPTRPKLSAEVVSAAIDDHLLLGCNRSGRMISLDGVSAVIASSLDGQATPTELGEDLAVATDMDPETATKVVLLLLDAMAGDGFIEGVPPVRGIARGTGAVIPADSCLAVKMGLDRGSLRVADVDQPFRFGSTDTEVVTEMEAILGRHGVPVKEDADEGQPIVFLRATPGRVPRLQQLYGSLGRRWFARRDHDQAVAAFRRTVLAMAHEADGQWLEGVSLRTSHGIVLVQPGLEDAVMGDLRVPLECSGVVQVPSARLQLEPDGHAVIPPDPVSGEEDERCRIVGALLPESCSRPERVRQLSHLLVRWDQSSLESLASAVLDVPTAEVSGYGRDREAVARSTADLGSR